MPYAMLLLVVATLGLVAGQEVHNVAFSAGLTHDQAILHAETVVYDRVFVNVGRAYNNRTGVFTCPTHGVYVFQFHSLTHLDKSTWLELYKNTAYMASIYGHTAADYASGGNSVVLNLQKGDTVYIKAVDNSYGIDTNLYGQPNEVYSTFSGYLIAATFSETPVVGK